MIEFSTLSLACMCRNAAAQQLCVPESTEAKHEKEMGEEMPRRAGSGSKSPEWSASVRVFVTRRICKCVDDTFSTLTLVVMGYKM